MTWHGGAPVVLACGRRRPRHVVAAGVARAASGDAPVSDATRVPMRRGARRRPGPRTVARSGAARRYLYEVTVYAPTTGKVETNLVTDPYSVALTLNSTRSVAVDLRRPGARARRRGDGSPSPQAHAGRRLDDLRAARARLLDQRHAACPPTHRGTYLAFADDGDGTKHLKALAAAGPQHRAPAADLRHRLDRGGPGQAGDAGLRPRVVRAGQRPAAEVRHRGGRQGRLQLGLRPVPLDGARGVVRLQRQDRGRRRRGWPSSAPWSAACTATACGSCSTRCSTTPPASGQADTSVLDRIVPGYYQRLERHRRGARPRPAARTSPPSTRWRRRSWSTRWCRGRATTTSTASASTSWATTARPTCWPCVRPWTRLTLGPGRRRRQVHLPLRRGLELRRGGGQRAVHPGHARATSAARASAPSPTGCATPCAAVARSTRTRASRASAAASPPTPTARRSTHGAAASLAHDTDLVELGLAGNLKAFTFTDSSRRDGRGRPGRLQRRARRLRRPAGRGRQLRRRPRQRDALRLADRTSCRWRRRCPTGCG